MRASKTGQAADKCCENNSIERSSGGDNNCASWAKVVITIELEQFRGAMIFIIMMEREGGLGGMANATAACHHHNRAVLSAVKAALGDAASAAGPNSAFLMRRPNAAQKCRLQSSVWPRNARLIK